MTYQAQAPLERTVWSVFFLAEIGKINNRETEDVLILPRLQNDFSQLVSHPF
jgi:hypothetical protein